MYGLLTTTPFRIPIDPGPVAMYYPPPIEIVDARGDLVLNAAGLPTYHAQPTIERAAQAKIDAQFKRARNYYDSYLNIHRAVFNILDDNIDDAFRSQTIRRLWGGTNRWNHVRCSIKSHPHMENPLQQPYCRMIRFSAACIPRTTPPKYCSGVLKIAKKYRS
jgi:hypothetical protein